MVNIFPAIIVCLTVLKTYSFKLYSSRQNRHLADQLFIASQIYNHCIALCRRYYRLYHKHPSYFTLTKHFTKLRSQNPQWRTLGANACENAVKRVSLGYEKFFSDLKRGKRTSLPHFTPYRKYRSFTLRTVSGYSCGFKLIEENRIRIGKRIYKFSKSREIEGKIKTLTVKRNPLGEWFLFFACEVEIQPTISSTGNVGAFDFGLKTFLTSHEGKEIHSPEYFKQSLGELRTANQSLSRKKIGSGNRIRARLHRARIYERVTNRRRDFHFKTVRSLATQYDTVFFEDLSLKGMQRLWGRKVNDLGFYQFTQIAEHVFKSNGKRIEYIDRFEPSSKTCSDCKSVVKELKLSDREWVCPTCGSLHNRDHNAAKNILRVGLSTLALGDVRPTRAVAA